MNIESTLSRLQDMSLPTEIRESDWLFPTLESVHVLALVLLVGSIMTVDLRLLGFANKERRFSELASEMLPWAWSAFAVAVLVGALMFTSKAVAYWDNVPFRLKMLSLGLAGTNMLWFHWVGARKLALWDAARAPPGARFAAGASLLLWTSIVAAGRWIAFTI